MNKINNNKSLKERVEKFRKENFEKKEIEKKEFKKKKKKLIEHQNILNYFENIQNKLGFNINNIEDKLKKAKEKSKDLVYFQTTRQENIIKIYIIK